jgi:hypothetical protein
MKEKRILLLSFYFKPDLSAGSFRTTALVDELLARNLPSTKIDVITTLPNRYSSFNLDAQDYETKGAVTIHRIKLPTHRSGMLDQAKAFVFFANNALRIAKGSHCDLVFATSSRLMTAALGAWVANRARVPLYLDIRDIFVDTIKDVLSKNTAFFLRPFFSMIEYFAFKSAAHVNLVSPGFEPYFKERYPDLSFSYFTNGIDDGFLLDRNLISHEGKQRSGPIKVLYAGNIGEGQGLHSIIPQLARNFGERVIFKIFGDGGRKGQLERALTEQGATNVELLPPISRDQLIKEYLAADVLFLHLNDYDAFKKVLPSKIFEYAALGKPIWAGVAGYAAEFLSSEVNNVAVFPPCDALQAIKVFERLDIRDAPRDKFVEKFQRKAIMRLMADDLLSFLEAEKVS